MKHLFPDPLAIVDVETTGMSPTRERIIEIAILRVEKGKIVGRMSTLVNPGTTVPPEITVLTGITSEQIIRAPGFFDIKDDVKDLLDGSVLVAHNVRFDYAFLRAEFRRYEESLTMKHLDTVRLFRALYPQAGRFNLDRLIEFFRLTPEYRHRAEADAAVLYDFLKIVAKIRDKQAAMDAVSRALRRPSIPQSVNPEDIENAPEAPGVYLFYGENDAPLYVGKSINIRERLLSHFTESLTSGKEMKLNSLTRRIEWRRTPGELSALLLESSLVKKLQPLYNRQLRHAYRMVTISAVEEPGKYDTVRYDTREIIEPNEVGGILGVYKSKKQAQNALQNLAKEHALCPKLLGLENGGGACFWHGLDWCHGACVGKEPVARYNLRFAEAFRGNRFKRWPFPGPVMISEESEGLRGNIFVDQWCLIGQSTEDRFDGINLAASEYTFDIDTYKILVRHLISPSHQRSIRLLGGKPDTADTGEDTPTPTGIFF